VPDLVIFDCDGVLVDSELIFARVLAECLTAADFSTTLDEAITLGFGTNRATLSAAVAARFGGVLPHTFLRRVPTSVCDPAAPAAAELD
jgi:beta-phosphoglucomutase-like phosphatase (HAD superfamily)